MYIRQTEATRRSDLLGDQSWARTSESDFSARVSNLVSELLEFKEVRNLSGHTRKLLCGYNRTLLQRRHSRAALVRRNLKKRYRKTSDTRKLRPSATCRRCRTKRTLRWAQPGSRSTALGLDQGQWVRDEDSSRSADSRSIIRAVILRGWDGLLSRTADGGWQTHARPIVYTSIIVSSTYWMHLKAFRSCCATVLSSSSTLPNASRRM